jgi:hypothetical protein
LQDGAPVFNPLLGGYRMVPVCKPAAGKLLYRMVPLSATLLMGGYRMVLLSVTLLLVSYRMVLLSVTLLLGD